MNLDNGEGTGSLQQKQDGTSGVFDFTDKNPNATQLDPTLTGNIPYGAVGDFAVVLGGKGQGSGKRSLAQGTTTIAKGNYSHSEGDNSVALGSDSHAEGYQTVSYGPGSHSEGENTIAMADRSHAEGNNTVANGNYSHSEGQGTNAEGLRSHAEGLETTTYGEHSHTEGQKTITQNNYIIVDAGEIPPTPQPPTPPSPTPPTPEEYDAMNGVAAHAEGYYTVAFGIGSHSEGEKSRAYARYAHAEGGNTQAGELVKRKTENNKDYYTTNSSAQYQHSEGENTLATGNVSHAEGYGTKALGTASHSGGYETVAGYDYQTIIGRYNNNKQETLFEVGNGSVQTPSNAFEVTETGIARAYGTPVGNNDLIRKVDLDTAIANAITRALNTEV